MPELQRLSPLGRQAPVVNMAHLGSALVHFGLLEKGHTYADPARVHTLIVYNSNSAAIEPHQSKVAEGLQREDLCTVSLEQFQTDTSGHADIVLPATTFLEHTDHYLAYGHYHCS
jgi:anaerobic selenocysteine-containing dehydrogenase